MGQIQFTISLILIGLFAIAIIGFAINFAIDNDSYVDLSDDAELSTLYINTEASVSDFDSDAENTYTSIINSTIASGDETTISGGQFKITPVNALGVVNSIIRVGYIKIFGNDSGFGIFMTTFFAVLLFILGLLIWKTWAGRSPD